MGVEVFRPSAPKYATLTPTEIPFALKGIFTFLFLGCGPEHMFVTSIPFKSFDLTNSKLLSDDDSLSKQILCDQLGLFSQLGVYLA